MSIDKYINWGEIWEKEVCLETAKDVLPQNLVVLIKRFQQEEEMELLLDECTKTTSGLTFFFGETGGQNESDTQGWSRDYVFTVGNDFLIIDVEYSQG